jgi:NADPH:quinone reductase-like Zn-dependent oxidoreductase
MEMTQAAAVPLVAVTADQLIRKAANVQPGQTVLITGALGSVGRCAVFCAKEIGATVIAGVRKSQLEDARALPGVTEALDVDDASSLAKLGMVDAVADAVGGDLAPKLLAKVKQGGTYGSVLGPPRDAALHPTVTVNAMSAVPDPEATVHYAEAVRDRRLILPIDRIMPLAAAAEAQALAEKHKVSGKLVLVP